MLHQHWGTDSKGKIPGCIVGSWEWCQEKPSLLATIASEIQKSVLDQSQSHFSCFTSTSHSTLAWSPREDISKYSAWFSRRKLCDNRKNVLTWCNICFQFLTFVSYYLHKLHQTLSLFPHWHKGIIVSASCSYENQMGYCIWNFCETNNIIQGCAGMV